MLSALNTPARKILTIEDPIEYEIAGINQSQVKPAIGLTFAAAMRAFVRQDPDVIMVGEVRDAETANIAIHAALTGHLVLTTLHTETRRRGGAAPDRSRRRGVPAQIDAAHAFWRSGWCACCASAARRAASALRAPISTRDPRYEVCGLRAGESSASRRGCERCGGVGYRGRIGVFEALEVSGEVRDLIGPQRRFAHARRSAHCARA